MKIELRPDGLFLMPETEYERESLLSIFGLGYCYEAYLVKNDATGRPNGLIVKTDKAMKR